MLQLEKFKNPDAKYRIQPFWFWNGEMDEQEIHNQIMEMADKGVGGFFICPRQGLGIPYLSEEWFQKVKFATDTAKKMNMEVWLYDEYPYPSGIAGGEVTLQHPDAKHYTLVHKSLAVEGGQSCSLDLPWGRLLSAKAVPIDEATGEKLWEQSVNIEKFIGNFQSELVFQKAGLTAYNQKRFFTYRTEKKCNWTAPEGKWEIHCFLEVEIDDFKYYGTFVDPCHEEAIKTFIDVTHEKYAEHLGEEFGKTVKGMFTDETGLLGKIPWSPQLVDFIKETKGYDLRDHLHELIDGSGDSTAKIRYDYFQAIHILLRKSYHKQISDWCEEHNIEYVAEVPSVRMTTQLYSHVPGGDTAHEKLGRSLDWILNQYTTSFRANPKMVSSLGNQLGRERALIECFHSVGWSMTLQDAKWMLDRLGAFGINFYNFHAFFYTLDGLTKHDAPPSQFLQNPYWEHFRLLGDYAGRLGYVMSCGAPVRSIAVLDPTTTLWTHMGNPFHSFHYSGENEEEKARLARLTEDWASICKQLTLHQKDYDHLDAEILAQAEIVDGKIKIGKASYEVLILPPMSNLEAAAWEKITEFIEKGGVVIANGLLPYEQIDKSGAIKEDSENTFGIHHFPEYDYWNNQNIDKDWVMGHKKSYFIPSGKNQLNTLVSIIDDHVEEPVRFELDDTKSFLVEKRILQDGSQLVFISNQEEGEHSTSLYLEATELQQKRVQRLHLDTGDVEQLEVNLSGDRLRVDLHFYPYQSYLLYITDESQEKVEAESSILELKAGGTWEINALQENALRFDAFELIVGEGEKPRSMVQVKTFIDQCADFSDEQQLPLAFNQVFGTPMKLSIQYPVTCTYTKTFTVEDLPSICSLLMDGGAISGEYRMFVNDRAVTDFKQSRVYDQHNQVCEITPLLVKGENTLRIEVQVSHDYDGVVDALYLLGDFGIQFDENEDPVIIKASTTSTLHGGPYEGLPYYAGTISFKRQLDIETLPSTEAFILQFSDLDKDFHDCMEVIVNGESLGVRAWTPYQWKGLTSNLNEGKNEVEVKVTNTLIGFLEGKYFDYKEHLLRNVR